MGNCFGKPSTGRAQLQNPAHSAGHGEVQNPNEQKEGVEPRFVSCEESINIDVGQFQIRYGFMSQRGYYPDGE